MRTKTVAGRLINSSEATAILMILFLVILFNK